MRLFCAAGLAALALASAPATAQVIFTDTMDSGAAWTVRQTADSAATFGYDYSAMGVPAAPNGTGTSGLRMVANENAPGALEEISAVASGVNATGRYLVEFDFWANANGPFPLGGAGSTQHMGGGIGLNGVEAGRDGASLLISGEGGSSSDWRLYKNKGVQSIPSLQYNPVLTSNDSLDPFLSANFPGQQAPQFQRDNFAQQTGTVGDGTVAFGWHRMAITVDSTAIGSGTTQNPGLARFEVDGVFIGTIDNSNGGTVVDMTGGVGVIYADLFASLTDNTALSFGLFDNFRVTQLAPVPGPEALPLFGGGLAALGACLRRRRQAGKK